MPFTHYLLQAQKKRSELCWEGKRNYWGLQHHDGTQFRLELTALKELFVELPMPLIMATTTIAMRSRSSAYSTSV
jgi:hypothetical protein